VSAPGEVPTTRGETRLTAKAVHSVVQGVAEEVPGVLHVKVSGAPRTYLAGPGNPSGGGLHDEDDDVRSEGPSDGGLHLTLDAGFAYPGAVLATAEALRSHVRRELVHHLGEPNVQLHLNVAELVPPGTSADAPRVR